MDFLKSVTGRVVGGIVSLAVVTLGIAWWQMDVSTRDAILGSTGKIFAWVGIVALVPWATFFVSTWVATFESNLAAGIMVFLYTAAESYLLARLFRGFNPGATGITFFVVGTLLAGVYNLLICDLIAEKMES